MLLSVGKEEKKYFIYASIKVVQKEIQETIKNGYLQGKLRPMGSMSQGHRSQSEWFPTGKFEYQK